MTPALECRRLQLAYDRATVIDGLDVTVAAGETLALLGPSGSGKTTLLYAVAGFVVPRAGEIRIAGQLAAGGGVNLPPERRRVAVVFQHYALWPHLDARDTVAYPLLRRGIARHAARARAVELLDRMGVGHLADRLPSQLSGGEQQRVGVARALAREGDLLILDEPTAHLDTPLRAALQAELTAQRQRSGAAALYATHDVAEALAVADRVAILRGGALVQVGTPREIYERPADLWTARLSGPASILAAALRSAGPDAATVEIAGRTATIELAANGRAPGPVELLVRPDWASLGGELPGRVSFAWYRGPHTDYRLETPAGELELREAGPPRVEPGSPIGWSVRRAWAVSAESVPPHQLGE